MSNLLELVTEPKTPAISKQQTCLKNDGSLIGSTPFLYHVHGAPEDYLRYTKTYFEKKIKTNGYELVLVKCMGQGPFLASFSLIYSYIKFVPIFSHIVLFILNEVLITKYSYCH